MQINEPKQNGTEENHMALFSLGFRVFFLAAGIFSVVSLSIWAVLLQYNIPFSSGELSSVQWHAHEMIFGYSVSVIAGFLLTAVKNWTNVKAISGKWLAVVFSLWLVARLSLTIIPEYLYVSAFFDMLFLLALLLCIAYPIFKVRQWNQSIILVILGLLIIFNGLFYAGAFDYLTNGIQWGLYGGLYLVIGLILIMGRRVIPFFIEKGVGNNTKLMNYKFIDSSIVILFSIFIIFDVFINNNLVSAMACFGLFIANVIRLYGWHSIGIWNNSMLWSLYIAMSFICLGFLLMSLSYYVSTFKLLAIHAFAVGGIGMVTMSMMSRVALGHSGRDVSRPPKAIPYALIILILSGLTRVLPPIFSDSSYLVWVGISQVLWILAFAIFTISYAPILWKPSIRS